MLAWALSGFVFPLRAQDKAKRMDSILSLKASMHLFSGTVLVYDHGKTILHKAYGWQDAGKKIANTRQGIYQIYSVTKPFTSTMILMLVEQGKLSLDDKLSKFYPKAYGADSITIRHLLSHQSGLFEYTRLQDTAAMTIPRFLSLMEKQPLDFTPGTQWSYSNSGYWFLGLIIEKITGTTYEKAVTRFIFQPLGMTHSGFDYNKLQHRDRSTGYASYEDGEYKRAETYAAPGPYAAGDIWSNTADLLLFHQAMQTNKLISAGMTTRAYTPLARQYGLGWMTDSIAGKLVVKHSGGAAGFRSYLVRIPEDDGCVIVLGNTEHDVNSMTAKLTDIMYNKPVHIPRHQNISSAILNRYEGIYQLNSELTLDVYVERGRLVVQPSGQHRTVLFTEEENRFYVEEIDGFVRFQSNGQRFDTLELFQGGVWHKAPRVLVRWGITGSATPNGWDGPDLVMVPGAVRGTWELRDLVLADGEIKFRVNNSWFRNYGLNASGELQGDGENIVVQAGKYDVLLDLRDLMRPIYRIIRK